MIINIINKIHNFWNFANVHDTKLHVLTIITFQLKCSTDWCSEIISIRVYPVLQPGPYSRSSMPDNQLKIHV